MKTPLQLEAHGFTLPRHAHALIRDELEKLETRFGNVVACRVAIRPPGEHHRMGEPFAVSIHLLLPGGREVNVGRVSRGQDPRYGDLTFALHATFRKAIRQLQRQVQRLRAPTSPQRQAGAVR